MMYEGAVKLYNDSTLHALHVYDRTSALMFIDRPVATRRPGHAEVYTHDMS